jgi:hypothetical protein
MTDRPDWLLIAALCLILTALPDLAQCIPTPETLTTPKEN